MSGQTKDRLHSGHVFKYLFKHIFLMEIEEEDFYIQNPKEEKKKLKYVEMLNLDIFETDLKKSHIGLKIAVKLALQMINDKDIIILQDESIPIVTKDFTLVHTKNPMKVASFVKRKKICIVKDIIPIRINGIVLRIVNKISSEWKSALNAAYFATCAISHVEDYLMKLKKLKEISGMRVLEIFIANTHNISDIVSITNMGVESGLYPLFEVFENEFRITYRPEFEDPEIFFNAIKKDVDIDKIKNHIRMMWKLIEKNEPMFIRIEI